MIFISTAMYCEASPFISKLHLKKDTYNSKFQIFEKDDIKLIITGTGMISSASALTYMLTKYNASSSDIFVNIGVCGGSDKISLPIGTVFLCNKIINNDNKKSFYPDMLFKHPFKEASLESFSHVVTEKDNVQGDLVDMEGAGVFQAASIFLPPHQIMCIKILLDFLNTKGITKEKVSEIINPSVAVICNYINEIAKINLRQEPILSEAEEDLILKLGNNMKLTNAMGIELVKLAEAYKVRKGEIIEALNPFLNINCKSKYEGKMCFGRIKNKLMEL